MGNMNKEDLEKVFKIAKAHNLDVCVELTIPERKAHEFIIVLNDNLDYKMNYYRENYNENLILKRCEDIRIVNAFGFVFGKPNDKGYNL